MAAPLPSASDRSRPPRQPLPLGPLAVRRSLRDEVYDRLRGAILAGDLAAETRVIPEEVARSMGVSRTPVVQALDRLAREGLLETLPNGRVVVSGVSEQAAREMVEIRTALEAYAGRLAAARGLEPRVLERLRSINQAMTQDAARLAELGGGRRARVVERIVEQNHELHAAINAASGNARLVRLLEETLDLGATQPVLHALSDQEFQEAIGQHAQVIEALAGGDEDRVERLLREHVSAPLSHALPRVARRATAAADGSSATER